MKISSTIILSLLYLFACTTNALCQVSNYNIGDVVDDFNVTDTNGNNWNLYSLTSSGKYVYLDFFFDTCPPCQITQHVFNEFYDKYGCNEGDIIMLTINNGTDTNEEVIAYENEYGGPFQHSPAVGIEGGCEAVDINFGINGYPSYLLISPENIYLGRIEESVSEITVEAFEDSFPKDFNPAPLKCSLNIYQNLGDLDFKIYPNPNNGYSINISLNQELYDAELTIYSIEGSVIAKFYVIDSQHIFETNLSSGVYILELKNQLGNQKKTLLVK